MAYILFDIGGTKTRIALSHDLTSFDEPIKFDTPKDYAAALELFVEKVRSLTGDEPIAAIAGGIRGRLNSDHTGLSSEIELTDWVDKPLTKDLEQALGAPVYLENDAAIAALGEAHFGGGKGYDIVAYHTVSTGVGGARVVSGKIDAADVGFEPGHQILDVDQTILGTDTAPTLENLVSGTALEARRGVKPYEIPQDDPVWDELAGYLARGLANTIMYWSPDIIVLGGSMILGDPRIFLEDIKRHTAELFEKGVSVPPIVDAELGDYCGLYGAMARITQAEK